MALPHKKSQNYQQQKYKMIKKYFCCMNESKAEIQEKNEYKLINKLKIIENKFINK